MDSDPSLSCSDTGDGYPLSDLSDSVTLPGLMGPEDLAATLVALKEAPELNRLVQDVVDGQQSVAVPQGMWKQQQQRSPSPVCRLSLRLLFLYACVQNHPLIPPTTTTTWKFVFSLWKERVEGGLKEGSWALLFLSFSSAPLNGDTQLVGGK